MRGLSMVLGMLDMRGAGGGGGAWAGIGRPTAVQTGGVPNGLGD